MRSPSARWILKLLNFEKEMKMKYRSNDKRVYRGETATDIVRAMLADSFEPELELGAFMRRTAEVSGAWAKQPVRSDTPENFINDLLAARILFPFFED